ncbi:DEAD/DEAH box helicase [Demequina sp. TTPB684]|uniref:DEAD/DEAH box helicase n=1 Tax=unclassified Demequina TaxID=2620311 RepID=UPI001CF41BBD|nr:MULTISPECIES: DEAD/DEAH box helicase [unclassified Demequina]MCB2413746.1 DEAD/DEAH box helicase [Demequina sp. TTPB684]UPU89583.1 DEAD/DEAH box helicase [Demequina sp. TMPB413]
MLKALARFELTTAFPIQSATIADAMAGRDVLGKARTGSGKTLAFGLPMLARLAGVDRPAPRRPLALVLVPTRELAMQVGDALEPYAHALGLSHRLIAGGLSMSKQIVSLERGVHMLVATPGRLSDLMRRGNVDLSEVMITVLDEADHMAEMGFAEEITEILDTTRPDAQRLLFSATLDGVVDTLVARFMTDPVLHDVTDGKDAPSQRHVVLSVPPHEKYRMATRIAAREGRTLCFVRTKLAADRVAADMRSQGVLAVALHGDRAQNERNLAMTEFRAGRLPVLVATDVAARGIHVDAVDLVLQIDPPADYRDYTHRAGRTGRAGADGLAVLLSLPHQRNAVQRILDNAGIDAEEESFRTIDAKALERIDQLTGAQEPHGVPVDEPLPAARSERPGRGRRGERPSARGERVGARSDRFASRPSSRPAARRDDSSFDRERLTAKERELIAREQALAERERRLEQAESQGSGSRSAATESSNRSSSPRASSPRTSSASSSSTQRPPRSGAPTHRQEPTRESYGAPTHRDPRGPDRKPYRGKPDDNRSDRAARDDRAERKPYRGKPDDNRPTRAPRPDRPNRARPQREGSNDRGRDGASKRWTDKAADRRSPGPTRAERREREFAPRDNEAAARFGDDFDPTRTPRKPRAKKSADGKKSKGSTGSSSRRGKPRIKGSDKKSGPKKPKRN